MRRNSCTTSLGMRSHSWLRVYTSALASAVLLARLRSLSDSDLRAGASPSSSVGAVKSRRVKSEDVSELYCAAVMLKAAPASCRFDGVTSRAVRLSSCDVGRTSRSPPLSRAAPSDCTHAGIEGAGACWPGCDGCSAAPEGCGSLSTFWMMLVASARYESGSLICDRAELDPELATKAPTRPKMSGSVNGSPPKVE